MTENTIETDICVIGAGSGGLSVAAGAAQMGARCVLVERGKMGGDCLNYGCVPSKAMIAAGHAARTFRASEPFGIATDEPSVDFQKVHDHVHDVIAGIAPHDSVERFEGFGVTVLQESASFTGPREIVAGGTRVKAKYFVIATGSTASIPPIPGIDAVPCLTNETIFDLVEGPKHLVVIGAGPIGCEMAQAHRRLGAQVTLLEMFTALGKDDPETSEIVRKALVDEGIDLRENIQITSVNRDGDGVGVDFEDDGKATKISGSHLLVAGGRNPNLDGLGLDEAGVKHTPKGIEVDSRLRTSNRRIFAIGDVAGPFQFTHMASYHAGIVIRNILFKLPAKVSHKAVPWVTYTDPELAQVGIGETEARERLGDKLRVLRWPFAENDRARCERVTEGLLKVFCDKRGRIYGASIAGAHAGEMILPWTLAIGRGLKIGAMAGVIAPYPTLSEISKRAAGSFYTPSLFSNRTRKIVRFLMKL